MKKLFTLLLVTIFTFSFSQCPKFEKEQSNPYYLLFTSPTVIQGTGSPLVINDLRFVDAGNWYSQETYHASWTNISGTPLNINDFEVTFGNLTCHYPSSTLAVVDVYKNVPLNLNYKVYDFTGKLLQTGKTVKNLLTVLPKNTNIILQIDGYKNLKIRL